MLEIVVLISLCKKLAALARGKNRSSAWGALGAVCWIGGEITGFAVGGTRSATDMGAYGWAILGAIVGALISFLVVRSLPEIPVDTGLPPARVV